jgi:hypothetical protein
MFLQCQALQVGTMCSQMVSAQYIIIHWHAFINILTCFNPKRWDNEVRKSLFNISFIFIGCISFVVCPCLYYRPFLPGGTGRDVPILPIFPRPQVSINSPNRWHRVFKAEIGVPLSVTIIFIHFILSEECMHPFCIDIITNTMLFDTIVYLPSPFQGERCQRQKIVT